MSATIAPQLAGRRIGLDIGGTRLKAGLVVDGRVVQRRIIALENYPADSAGMLTAIGAAVREWDDVSTLGMGVAAIVDHQTGTIVASPNMPFLDGFSIAEEVAKRTTKSVRIDNDVNCIGWGEFVAGTGAAGCSDVVCLALGTGLGGALIRGGGLHRGGRGMAAELGHLAVVPDGPRCGCGGRGCAEQYVSQTGLRRLAADSGWRAEKDEVVDVPAIFAAAAEGDIVAASIVRQAADALGRVIAWCVQLLSPQAIVLAGGIAAAWPQLRENAESTARSQVDRTARLPRIVVGRLAEDAGIVGAAMLQPG